MKLSHRTLSYLLLLLALVMALSACTPTPSEGPSDTSAATTETEQSEEPTEPETNPNNENESEKNIFTMEWTNPITYPKTIEDGKGFRDPYIIKDGDWWYLTGTMYPHFEGDQGSSERSKGVPLYKTQDFVNWEFVDIILPRPAESEGKWYQNYFWAPEIFLHNGRYYLTVNCSTLGHFDPAGGSGTLQAVCIAVADNIEGPYTVITEEKPYIYQNDAHLFKDDDGRVYIFYGGIYCSEIDLNTGKPIGNPIQVIQPVKNSTAWNAERGGVAFEGAYAMKRNGTYYLFYSTWARGYEIGIAELTEAYSPLTTAWKLHELPFYGAMNKSACGTYGAMDIYDPDYYVYHYYEAGHNSVFLGPDGSDWIAAHVFVKGYNAAQVKLVIDKLYFEDGTFIVKDNDGNRVNGPTNGTQKIECEYVTATPVKALDTWEWRSVGSDYTMPAYSDILFSNGWRESYPVTWEGEINTSAKGTQTVQGYVTYNDVNYPCTLTVEVN